MNTKMYHELFNVVNHELKAIMFCCLERSPMFNREITDKVNQLVGNARQYSQADTERYSVSLEKTTPFVEETLAKDGVKYLKAWYLTDEGALVRDAAAYALSYLPKRFGVSAFQVLGKVQSRNSQRNTQLRARILEELANGEKTLDSLLDLTRIVSSKLSRKLHELETIVDVDGGSVPFVEITLDYPDFRSCNGVIWTGQELDSSKEEALVGTSQGMKLLALAKKLQDLGGPCNAMDLVGVEGYGCRSLIDRGIRLLKEQGVARSYFPREYTRVNLTDAGAGYVTECLQVVKAVLAERFDGGGHVEIEIPGKLEFLRAADVYAKQFLS